MTSNVPDGIFLPVLPGSIALSSEIRDKYPTSLQFGIKARNVCCTGSGTTGGGGNGVWIKLDCSNGGGTVIGGGAAATEEIALRPMAIGMK